MLMFVQQAFSLVRFKMQVLSCLFVVVPMSFQFSKHLFCYLDIPSTRAAQEFIPRHWVYTGFSSQSLCWASLGLFHEGTILEMSPGFKFVHAQNQGSFSSSLWVPPYCVQIPGLPFPCSSGQKAWFLSRFSLQSAVAREKKGKKGRFGVPFPGSSFGRWLFSWGFRCWCGNSGCPLVLPRARGEKGEWGVKESPLPQSIGESLWLDKGGFPWWFCFQYWPN